MAMAVMVKIVEEEVGRIGVIGVVGVVRVVSVVRIVVAAVRRVVVVGSVVADGVGGVVVGMAGVAAAVAVVDAFVAVAGGRLSGYGIGLALVGGVRGAFRRALAGGPHIDGRQVEDHVLAHARFPEPGEAVGGHVGRKLRAVRFRVGEDRLVRLTCLRQPDDLVQNRSRFKRLGAGVRRNILPGVAGGGGRTRGFRGGLSRGGSRLLPRGPRQHLADHVFRHSLLLQPGRVLGAQDEAGVGDPDDLDDLLIRILLLRHPDHVENGYRVKRHGKQQEEEEGRNRAGDGLHGLLLEATSLTAPRQP